MLPIDDTPFQQPKSGGRRDDAGLPDVLDVLNLGFQPRRSRSHAGPPVSSVLASQSDSPRRPPPNPVMTSQVTTPGPSRSMQEATRDKSVLHDVVDQGEDLAQREDPAQREGPAQREVPTAQRIPDFQQSFNAESPFSIPATRSTVSNFPPPTHASSSRPPPAQVQRAVSAAHNTNSPASPDSSPPQNVEPQGIEPWVSWSLRAQALVTLIAELEAKLP